MRADGVPNDFNGQNRGLNTANPSAGGHDPFDARITTLLDPTGSSTILPGSKDIAATVGDSDDTPSVTGGYIWDSVLRAGKSVRHYGMYADATYYQVGRRSIFRSCVRHTRTACAKHRRAARRY